MSRLDTACSAALVVCLLALPAAAQDAAPDLPQAPPPANLAFIDGAVDLIHEGVAERRADPVMLVDGDVVRTGNGRAEIVFADGTVLHLNHDTELEILSPLRLRLATGRVLLRVSAAAASPYVIDAQAASTRFFPRGEYDVTADRRFERLEIAVVRGTAEIDDGVSPSVARSGEMASILGPGGRVLLQTFNSARFDAFEQWSSSRVNGFSTAISARQLPSELRAYSGLFDSYGRWDYVAPYGSVWFPAVAAAWRPYYTGSWTLTRYGWTWIGYDPWAWPTHHYGRWGFTGAAWYWIPHRTWGPAWVSWLFVPGYVSWSPLGWDNRAVLRWSHRPGDHPVYWPDYDPYRSWTVVPRDQFGNRRPVRAHAVDPMRLPEQTRRAIADVAVPRGTGPGVSPGAVITPSNQIAVPRSGAPAVRDEPRRDSDPWNARDPDPWNPSRRGGVRAPDAGRRAEPGASGATYYPPYPPYPPAGSEPTDAVERGRSDRGDSDRTVPPVYPPSAYQPRADPAPSSGDDRPRRDPSHVARPQGGGRSTSGERAEPAPRSDSDRGRPAGAAVPRSGGDRARPARPAAQSDGQSGGARRRPPK